MMKYTSYLTFRPTVAVTKLFVLGKYVLGKPIQGKHSSLTLKKTELLVALV
jgi:hypothetical protein